MLKSYTATLSFLAAVVLVPMPLSAQETVPRFEPTDCPFETEKPLEGVDCGELVVWENRDRHDEGTLRLAVAILRSTGENPEPDPLVFISGGPGGRSVFHTPARVSSEFWQGVRESRDVIFYDQRGTGFSEPEFCEDLDRVMQETLHMGLAPEEFAARRREALAQCRTRMLEKGIDFSAYNSKTSARDLNDLRQALGYERWNLLGLSYGTKLALTAMRETPDGIRSVILDSVAPPNARLRINRAANFARVLELAFEQCAADEACRRAYPTLESDFYAWLDALDREPVELAMSDTTRFPAGRIVIDGGLAAGGVFQGFYDRRFIPIFPVLVEHTGPEASHVWRALAEQLVRPVGQSSRGLQLAVNCYEVAPFNPPETVKSAWQRYPRLRTSSVIDAGSNCSDWHEERADPSFFEPVRSDIPTLILAGEFDPITPPEYGRLAANTLTNSTVVEAPAIGHGVTSRTRCTRRIATDFLDDPAQPPDTDCVANLPSVKFVTDVHTNRGIYPLARMIQQGPGLPVLAGAGIVGLILLSGPLGWPIAASVRRLRGRPSTYPAPGLQRWARWLAALAALLALAFAAGVVLAIRETASANPFLLAFGVSGEFGWLFYLPWILAAVTVAVVFSAVQAWRKCWWDPVRRTHYSLLAGACVAFVLAVGTQGLL